MFAHLSCSAFHTFFQELHTESTKRQTLSIYRERHSAIIFILVCQVSHFSPIRLLCAHVATAVSQGRTKAPMEHN